MNEHFTDDQLIDVMYGLHEDAGAHLAECADCARRMSAMQRVRASALETPAVANDFLAAQRRAIYTRLGEPRRASNLRWIPALGAAALLAIGFAVYHPAHAPVTAALDNTDAQLFSDVYSMEQADEPTVAAPLHTLFDDNSR